PERGKGHRNNRKALLNSLCCSFLAQATIIPSFYFLSLSLHIKVELIHLIMFVPMIELIANLPLSYGGLGIREALAVFLFTSVGLTSVDALSLSLLFFLTMIIISLFGGGLFLASKLSAKSLSITHAS
ncbi:MAG: flippase-like domain-containing protein, partial [Deltaproteobacteria bacterium]|nr:flippase-like domain-containing protein [Deltaproteobacteria bacterium]